MAEGQATGPDFDKYIFARRWKMIGAQWLNHVPNFGVQPGAKPEPGVENLPDFVSMEKVTFSLRRHSDGSVAGLRRNVLWEAVYLFHKCAHAHVAAQRLGAIGMQSWALFNAYHSALLGAKGILALLGVCFSQPGGLNVLIDVFPKPSDIEKKAIKEFNAGVLTYSEFAIVRCRPDQSDIWAALTRTLAVTQIDDSIAGAGRAELRKLKPTEVTPPRNRFIYKAYYWPDLLDLLEDQKDYHALFNPPLRAEETGFLMRLSCVVFRVLEEMLLDLGQSAEPVRLEVEASRVRQCSDQPELAHYQAFVSREATLRI